MNPVELPDLLIVLDGIVVNNLIDTLAERSFNSYSLYNRYFRYKKLKYLNLIIQFAQGSVCE